MDGNSRKTWSGVEITHAPEPGTPGTASVIVYKQSDNTQIAESLTSGTTQLYYPNNPEYANANLTSSQGICEWDTYYYLDISPNTPIERREMIAIRKFLVGLKPPDIEYLILPSYISYQKLQNVTSNEVV